MTRAWPSLISVSLVVAVAAAACGTGDGGVELVDPVPTLFADHDSQGSGQDASDPATSEATEPAPPIADLLPSPRPGGLGVIEIAGVAVPVTAATVGGWEVATPCGFTAEITDRSPRSGILVVLDPGHGGDDDGAQATDPAISEDELNVAVAVATAARLEAQGIATLVTRTADIQLPAAARAGLVEASGALVFVSIHHRGEDGPLAIEPGTEVFHQVDSEEGSRLGGLIHEELTRALLVAGVDWAAPIEPGVRYLLNQRGSDFFTVLRETPTAASVLVEVASLASASGAAFLATVDAVEREATGLSEAVIRFLVTRDAGSGYVEPVERVREAPSGVDTSECVDPLVSTAD